MADKSRFGIAGSSAVLGAGVFALGAAVIGVAVNNMDGTTDELETAPEVAVLETSEPTPQSVPEAAETPDLTEEAVEEAAEAGAVEEQPAEDVIAAQVEDVPEETPAEPETPALLGPKFDVVRIDAFGSAVIAGTAAPGAKVILSAGGTQVADAIADRNGKYVALFDLPASATPRSLSAEMTTVDGKVVPSSGTVLIAPTKAVEVAEVAPVVEETAPAAEEAEAAVDDVVVAEAAEDPAEPLETETADASSVAEAEPVAAQNETVAEVETETAAEETVETEIAEAEPATEPVAAPQSPAIVLADETGVTVLQPAPQPSVPANEPVSDVAPEVVANLVIDTITYDTTGDVALSGRGEGASFARVYLNDKAVQTVKIADDGTWRTPLPDVDAGVYRLRIDEVTSEGTVTSRVETPFQREEPDVVAEAAQRPNAVTVQEGFTLWAIARERFGDGTQYVRVYEANRGLIRNPDLIYPGQIFELPEG